MDQDHSSERTETDERVAENRTPAPIASATRGDGDVDPSTGLPRGMHDDDSSPLDRGKVLDPFGGKSPAERLGKKPGEAQEQAFGSIPQHEAERR
ncbi:MAG: hypothetical protein JWM87_2868 [Candidatus Eremiobacteraeota bacterium]|nr:hypothetical protein [Candidatus Eremiobacteraeota bacterium]